MNGAELRNFLNEIATTRYETEHDFLAKVIGPFVQSLGYPEHQTFYDAILPASRRLRPDVLIAASRLKRPWLIIEAKLVQKHSLPFSSLKSSAMMQLVQYCDASGAEYGMVFFPSLIILIRRNGPGVGPIYSEVEYDLTKISEKDAAEILEVLRRPRLLPEETLESKQEATTSTISQTKSGLDLNRLRSMLATSEAAQTNDEKKISYESLAKFILEGLPFLRCKYTNLRTKSSEIDLVMEYLGWPEKTVFDWQGRYVLVECKNWDKPVGAAVVRDFIGKMSHTGTTLGIMFARNGITGESNGVNAVREIHSEHRIHNRTIIIFSGSDMDSLLAGISPYELIDQKIDAQVFDL